MSKGYGISFIDIDETLFRTFAKIHVLKDGEIIKKITNQKFNTYKLLEGESFEFEEFKDGELFKNTSVPIIKPLSYMKELLSEIKRKGNNSKIILLTARQDFYDKDKFLEAFRKQDIDIDDTKTIYIERSGNNKTESIEDAKKLIIMKYLETGIYDKCQIIDDFEKNIQALEQIANNFPKSILEKIIQVNGIEKGELIIKFRGLLVNKEGIMKETFSKEIIK